MDLALFLRVIARFKVLVACGFVVAASLAFLSYVQVDFDGSKPKLSYRSHEQWATYTRLLITQPGFKWGSSYSGAAGGSLASQAEVEGRLPDLANIYSSFVTSDPVLRLMLEQGPIEGGVVANALPAGPNSSSVLPIVNIQATGFTPLSSMQLAQRAADALRTYIEQEQRANGVPPRQRVVLAVLNANFGTELVLPRKKTMPVVIFLAVMFATVAAAFLLENLRPRVAQREHAPDIEAVEPLDPLSRRTA